MKQILLDTNAYSAFKAGHPEMVKILQHSDRIYINVIVLGELTAGFSIGTRYKKNLLELDEFLKSPRVAIIDINEMTPAFYANIYHTLRKKGKPIPSNNLWIAASALQHGLKLCSFDKHFLAIENLIVVTSFAEFL
jgi:predicted nucleic acid-binding protein